MTTHAIRVCDICFRCLNKNNGGLDFLRKGKGAYAITQHSNHCYTMVSTRTISIQQSFNGWLIDGLGLGL